MPRKAADKLCSTDRVAQIDEQTKAVAAVLRAALAADDGSAVASLSRQLSQLGQERAVLAAPEEVSAVDELANRRRNRRAGADAATPASGGRKRAR